MELLFKITFQDKDGHQGTIDTDSLLALTLNTQKAGGQVYYSVPAVVEDGFGDGLEVPGISPTEVIVALGSAGVFTALYQTITSYLARNKDREITLQKGKTKITIKGHSVPDEIELMQLMAPELVKPSPAKNSSRKVSRPT
jgi:hypothetical protein